MTTTIRIRNIEATKRTINVNTVEIRSVRFRNFGPQGNTGEPGLSAYEVAVENGFTGSEEEWLESLQSTIVGPQGPPGADSIVPGPEGPVGPEGPQGLPGSPGLPGEPGDSAYDVAVTNGFPGTEEQWLASLIGPEGPIGPQGEQGLSGLPGDSAYEVAVENGFLGTEEEWLDSLVGPQGPAGNFNPEVAIDYLKFDTTAGDPGVIDPGTLWWNAVDNTLNLSINGVTLQIGQEFLTRIVNKSGAQITNGSAVSVPSTSSAHGDRPKGEPTNVTSLTSARCFLGIATETIANDDEGFVTRFGLVRGLNLGTYTAGDRLWLTGTAGGLTNVEPTTGYKVLAGMVLRANAGDGIMLVNPRIFELTAEQAVVIDNLPDDSKKPAGFPNRTDSTIAFDNATKVFTIAPAVTSFSFYSAGKRFTKTTAQTVDLDTDINGDATPLAANTIYYIYFDASGVLRVANSAWSITSGFALVATINWNGTAGTLDEERHGLRDLEWHRNAHLSIGSRYISGLDLVAPTTAVDGQLDLTTGYLMDEDIYLTLTNPTRCRLFREVSAGVYTWVDGTDNAGKDRPYFWNTGTSRVQYNRLSDYSLQDLTNAQFVNVWVYGSNDTSRSIYILQPTLSAPHANLAAARTAPVLVTLSPEIKLLYRFIYRGDGEFQESQDYRNASVLPGGGTQPVAASSVSFSPTGDIAATNVQAAIAELDTEKAAASHDHTASDIDSGAATDGQVLTADGAGGAAWETPAASSSSFRGALVTRSGTFSASNSGDNVITAWDQETYDTDGFHDNSTNNGRLTIPTGVSKVIVSAGIRYTDTSTTGRRILMLTKDGSTSFAGNPAQSIPAASGSLSMYIHVVSPVLEVSAGQYFEVNFYQNSGSTLTVAAASQSWFAVEVVE